MLLILFNVQPVLRAEDNSLDISGASTIQPILDQISSAYLEETDLDVDIRAGGSGAGIENSLTGESDIGAVSRALTTEEAEELDYTTIGIDALVIVVNENNPITDINREDLIKVYTGEIDNWAQLGADDQSILLVSIMLGRSTLGLFEEYTGLKSPHRETIGEEGTISESSYEIGSNLEMITMVGGIPNAIGYVSLGTALNLQELGAPIKILDLDGIEPSHQNIIAGEYPIRRELNLVYQQLEQQEEEFLELILEEDGQKIVEKEGFIPVR
nr:substrate-binding domain-containing protein [Natroniella sulfidigena]